MCMPARPAAPKNSAYTDHKYAAVTPADTSVSMVAARRRAHRTTRRCGRVHARDHAHRCIAPFLTLSRAARPVRDWPRRHSLALCAGTAPSPSWHWRPGRRFGGGLASGARRPGSRGGRGLMRELGLAHVAACSAGWTDSNHAAASTLATASHPRSVVAGGCLGSVGGDAPSPSPEPGTAGPAVAAAAVHRDPHDRLPVQHLRLVTAEMLIRPAAPRAPVPAVLEIPGHRGGLAASHRRGAGHRGVGNRGVPRRLHKGAAARAGPGRRAATDHARGPRRAGRVASLGYGVTRSPSGGPGSTGRPGRCASAAEQPGDDRPRERPNSFQEHPWFTSHLGCYLRFGVRE